MRAARLSGRVVAGGASVSTAVVELRNGAGDVVDQIQVNDAGEFTYHLSTGTWQLQAWDNEGRRGRAEISVSEGESKTIDLDLASGGAS